MTVDAAGPGAGTPSTANPSADTRSTARFHLGGYPVVTPRLGDPRLRLTVVTLTLQVLGQVAFDFNVSIAQILIAIAAAGVVEFAVRLRRERVIAWPASALLTGNGVALILRVPETVPGDWWSTQGWYIFAGTSAAAVASKYLIRRRGRHIFNPSNLALVLTFVILGEQIVDPQILWWGPWSVPIAIAFVVILLGSLTITLQVGQMRTALSFWVTFSALVGVMALSGHAITAKWHVGPLEGWSYWTILVTSPEVLVFLFFMITDPKTSPSTNRGKVVFGTSIAVVSALIVSTQTGEFGTKVGILAGLVVVCPFVPLIQARTTSSHERRAPALVGARDPLTAGSVLVTGAPGRARRMFSVGLVLALCVPAVFLFGRARSFEGLVAAHEGVEIDRRSEVDLSGVELPPVGLDPTAVRSAFELTPGLATRIGTDVAHDLLIEAQAVREIDPELVAAAATGDRLEAVTRAITSSERDPTLPQTPLIRYRFDSLKVTLFKADDGPQTPPQLAVHVQATAEVADEVNHIDHTFTVVELDGSYLIANQFDSKRREVEPGAVAAALGGAGLARTGAGASPGPIQPTAMAPTPAELAGLRMSDRAAEMGLTLPHSRYDLGEAQNFRIGGSAVGDYDGDGWVDIFLTRVGYPNVLYRNDHGHFVDATADAGLGDQPPMTPISDGSTAAMFLDVNGDTHLDLMTLGMPGTPNRLYMGDGAGHFVDRSMAWGLRRRSDPVGASMPVAIAASDIDGDGDLDVLLVASEPTRIREALANQEVTTEEVCGAKADEVVAELPEAASNTVLLRNTGERFENATDALGVDPSRIAASTARFVDVDDDGRDDLVIGGSFCTSRLLINQGGSFVERTDGSGLDEVPRATAVATMDVDRDGKVDLFTTGIGYPIESGDCPFVAPDQGCAGNRLLLGDGDGGFRDASEDHAVRFSRWSWGAGTADLNNDSFEDLFVTNGITNVASWLSSGDGDAGALFEWTTDTPDELWVGAAGPPMRKVDTSSWVGFGGGGGSTAASNDGRAVLEADFDNDGRPDVLVVKVSAPPMLLMNEGSGANRWLGVRLVDTRSANTYGVGAVVRVHLVGGAVLRQRIGAERSYQSGGPLSAHFGVGAGTVAKVTVTWPDGTVQSVDDPGVDTRIVLTRSEGGG